MNKVVRLYTQLSFQSGFDKLGGVLFNFFIGAYLYSEGASFSIILLFYAIEFSFRGFIHILSPSLIQKINIPKSIALSYTLLLGFFLLLAFYTPTVSIIIAAALLHGLSRGLYYPAMHFWKSIYVQNEHRGRFYALETIIVGLVATGGVLASGSLLESGIIPIAILSAISLFLSLLILENVFRKFPKIETKEMAGNYKIMEVLRSKELKSILSLIVAHAFNVVTRIAFIPFLTFIITDSFTVTGIIFAVALAIEYIFVIIAGRLNDSGKRKIISIISSIILGILSFLFITIYLEWLPAIYLSILITLMGVVKHGYTVAQSTMYYEAISNFKKPLYLASVKESILCFVEGFIFLLLIPIALLSTQSAVVSGFVVGIIGAIVLIFAYSKNTTVLNRKY